ncbi:MAG: T9SS type A sorting domain-containing protein, partial [Candidatus Zixiibacteriota bacterium]
LPGNFHLSNYPNPFNTSTIINYQLPVDAFVKLDIYNLLGDRVARLVDSKQQTGYRSVIWDAREVSSGIYFYKLTAGDFTETQRMMLVK